jgi:hypothetical protein
MAGHAEFPDVELMLMEYLAPHGYLCTATPPDLQDRLSSGQVIRVNRVGGGESKNRTVDNPRVQVQVFALRDASDPRAAHDKASAVRTALMNLPAITAEGRLDSAVTESGPTDFPHPDPPVVRVQMIFRLSARR